MPIYPFAGIQTIVATSQPVFGTAMNGAGAMHVDPYSGNTNPGSNQSVSVLPVTSTIGFLDKQRVLVGPKGGPYDRGFITKIVANTSLTVQGLTVNHASGELIILDEQAAQVTIIPFGNANPIYIGNASTVSPTDPSVFDVIPATSSATAEPTYWHNPPCIGPGDAYKCSEYWVFGTVGDKFLARFSQI